MLATGVTSAGVATGTFARAVTALVFTFACLLIGAATASADLQETARWGGPALPADEATEWDGEFKAIGDLAVGPDGVVGATIRPWAGPSSSPRMVT